MFVDFLDPKPFPFNEKWRGSPTHTRSSFFLVRAAEYLQIGDELFRSECSCSCRRTNSCTTTTTTPIPNCRSGQTRWLFVVTDHAAGHSTVRSSTRIATLTAQPCETGRESNQSSRRRQGRAPPTGRGPVVTPQACAAVLGHWLHCSCRSSACTRTCLPSLRRQAGRAGPVRRRL